MYWSNKITTTAGYLRSGTRLQQRAYGLPRYTFTCHIRRVSWYDAHLITEVYPNEFILYTTALAAQFEHAIILNLTMRRNWTLVQDLYRYLDEVYHPKMENFAERARPHMHPLLCLNVISTLLSMSNTSLDADDTYI
jgi:hypothetical protein